MWSSRKHTVHLYGVFLGLYAKSKITEEAGEVNMGIVGKMILEEFTRNRSDYLELGDVVHNRLEELVQEAGLSILGIEHRIKTANSLAGKLEKKGFIERQDPGFICIPIVSQNQMQKVEAASLVKKLFGGSRKALFSALLEEEPLSDEEVEALRKLIENR